MAIVIPSKNIYGDPINAKIRDNVVDNVKVEITKVAPDNDYESPVFNSKLDFSNITQETTEKNDFQDRLALNQGGSTQRYIRIANSSKCTLTYAETPKITIKKISENKYISRVYSGKDDNGQDKIKLSVRLKTKIGSESGSYIPNKNQFYIPENTIQDETVYGFENINFVEDLQNYLNSMLEVTQPYRISSAHSIENIEENKTSIKQNFNANGQGNWLYIDKASDNMVDIINFDFDVTSLIKFDTIKVTQTNEHYELSPIKILLGANAILSCCAIESTNEISTLTSYFRSVITYIYAECEQLSITVNGDTIGISLTDGTVTYKNGNHPHSLSGNELLQEGTKTDNKITSEHLATGVLNSYARGKETAKLLCDIGEYKDENGDLKISVKNSQLPMNFNEGDLVIPMTKSANNEDLPMSRYKDGKPKVFEVVKTNFIYDGATWQELTLQEATQKGE